MAARTGCETCLGKLLHGRRDAFATGCDPGPIGDPRVDRTQLHNLTGHPDAGGPTGADRYVAITLFDRLNESWLHTFPALPKRPLRTTPVGSFETACLCGCWQMAVNVYPPCLEATDACPRSGLEGFGKKGQRVAGPDTAAPVLNEDCGTPYIWDYRRFTEPPTRPEASICGRPPCPSFLAVPGRNASAPTRDCNPPAGRHLTPIQPQSLGAPLRGPLPHRPRVPAPGGQPAPRLRGRSLPPAGTDPCPA